ncbi:MAG TPA: rRNA maturation RNase YbeY [Hanamia sp.]|nr:rRNA maturation RNase YbeY [Hanamia sp.]
MATISFNNQDVNPVLKSKSSLKAFLASIFKEEGCEFKNVAYIFCSDAFLLTLNQKYLDHDTLTDIITFSLSETHLPIISEIYISVERVLDNAKDLNVSFENELHRVMIHGILHLCGHSDHTKELKAQMRALEDYYLAKISF